MSKNFAILAQGKKSRQSTVASVKDEEVKPEKSPKPQEKKTESKPASKAAKKTASSKQDKAAERLEIRRRTVNFDASMEECLNTLLFMQAEKRLKPLNEQYTIELALTLATHPELGLEEAYHQIKNKHKRG